MVNHRHVAMQEPCQRDPLAASPVNEGVLASAHASDALAPHHGGAKRLRHAPE